MQREEGLWGAVPERLPEMKNIAIITQKKTMFGLDGRQVKYIQLV